MRKNPRLIPLDMEAIQFTSEKYVKEIAKEARRLMGRYPRTVHEPLGVLSVNFPVVVAQMENQRRGPGSGLMIVEIATDFDFFDATQIQELREGTKFSCRHDIVGGSYEPTAHPRRKRVNVQWCPALTLALVAVADESPGVITEVRDVLWHEITHASEFGGVADDYPQVSESGKERAQALGQDARYYNHPWELRAFARQIAQEAEREYRKQRRQKITAKYTGDTLESDIRWILDDIPKYRRVSKYLTTRNHKKLIQLVVRHLDEKGLFQ